MDPLIYLNSPENRTLALALNGFRGQYGVSDVHLLMAATRRLHAAVRGAVLRDAAVLRGERGDDGAEELRYILRP